MSVFLTWGRGRLGGLGGVEKKKQRRKGKERKKGGEKKERKLSLGPRFRGESKDAASPLGHEAS